MDTYNVKQIAEMLHTKPETVRRWIHSGKLRADKASNKDGHVVTKDDLYKFLESAPKYAGMASVLVDATKNIPVATVSVVSGLVATYLGAKKAKEGGDKSYSKEEITRILQNEIKSRNQSINRKLATIEQLQREIASDQQQITECNSALGQLANYVED